MNSRLPVLDERRLMLIMAAVVEAVSTGGREFSFWSA